MKSLSKLRFARYRFSIGALDRLQLPPYLGSTLRGGLGHVLRRLACPASRLRTENCPLGNRCPYHYLFETAPPEGSAAWSGLKSIPQPFVIEPPMEGRTEYEPGSPLVFHLTLVGQAIEYIPYFVVSFEELGRHGLGRGRGRFELQEVALVDPCGEATPIWDCGRQLADNATQGYTCSDLIGRQPVLAGRTRMEINFVSPTRLKFDNHLCDHPDFFQLYVSLARRLDILAYFHCGADWEGQPREEMEQARAVTTLEADLRWLDWRRYSNRQQAEMYLGGFMGSMRFEGDFAPFWPQLLLGQYLHLGKGATFGLGRYWIAASNGQPSMECQVDDHAAPK